MNIIISVLQTQKPRPTGEIGPSPTSETRGPTSHSRSVPLLVEEETDHVVEKGIKQEALARYQDHPVMAMSPAPAPKQGHLIHCTKLHTPALMLGVK